MRFFSIINQIKYGRNNYYISLLPSKEHMCMANPSKIEFHFKNYKSKVKKNSISKVNINLFFMLYIYTRLFFERLVCVNLIPDSKTNI